MKGKKLKLKRLRRQEEKSMIFPRYLTFTLDGI
jgi:hypothetical protein